MEENMSENFDELGELGDKIKKNHRHSSFY